MWERKRRKVKCAAEVSVGWLLSVDDPLPLFQVDVPPGNHRAPVKEPLVKKQRTKSENLPPPPIQLIRHGIIRGEGNDNRFPLVTGQLDVRLKHPCSRALSEITESACYGSGVVGDVVTVDIGGCAPETLGSAPLEELVLVYRPAEVEDRGEFGHGVFGD